MITCTVGIAVPVAMQHAIVERVGGDGGGPWDDRDYLQEQGWELGWGSRGVMLCSITYPG